MTSFRRSLTLAPLIPILLALLSSCGGGSGGGSGAPSSTSASSGSGSSGSSGGAVTLPSTTWVQGQFTPEASFAALCVTPRTGIDPLTQIAYPDRQGVLLDELNWLRSWTNDLYLWFSEVPDNQSPAVYTTDAAYFAVLKTTATTASGRAKDRFHFSYPTPFWESLEQSGVEPGYGVNFVVLASTPPRNVVVGYVEPKIPADDAAANLARGAKLLTIDGVDLVNATDQASIDTLNAGLSPQTVGETHTFTVLDAGASTPRSVTLVSANVTVTPVQNVKTIASPAGVEVGYMLFNDHLATAESALVDAFATLQMAGVKDLILDIRYNGGGILDIASELAYMVAGGQTAGQTFELSQFNAKHPTIDPVTGAANTPLDFLGTTQGFSVTAGQALPTLNLSRVFVLTGPSTCSASESIINSLQGIGVQVIQVGSTTCGKPYGFYPTDNCGVTYFSIQFQGVNAKGFGDYPDGFTPSNATTPVGVPVPGCSVADDFTHALGDPAEGLLSAALGYQQTGSCSVPPSGSVSPPPALASGAYVPPMAAGVAVKSIWRQNRIQRRPPGR